MQEIMLKNIWEIENNPIFSSGGISMADDKGDDTPVSGYTRLLSGGQNKTNLGLAKDDFKESKL